MSILKQWYLRLFKGWWLMDEFNMRIIKLHYWPGPYPTIIQVGRGRYMVSPPPKKVNQ